MTSLDEHLLGIHAEGIKTNIKVAEPPVTREQPSRHIQIGIDVLKWITRIYAKSVTIVKSYF